MYCIPEIVYIHLQANCCIYMRPLSAYMNVSGQCSPICSGFLTHAHAIVTLSKSNAFFVHRHVAHLVTAECGARGRRIEVATCHNGDHN